MPISMSRSAHYISPKIYNNIVGKPLSDRRIAYYQRQGRYDVNYRPPKLRRPASKKERALEELANLFV